MRASHGASCVSCIEAVVDYVGADKLVGSMAKRLREVIEEKGAMIDK